MTGSLRLRIGIISVVIGGHFGCGDHFDGEDHFSGGTTLRAVHIFTHTEAVAVHFTVCRFCTEELNLSLIHI